MPIQPENKHRYPDDWAAISLRLRQQAEWRCQWCDAAQGEPNPATGSTVMLTVAHLNHLPEDCRRNNLAVLCQRCHFNYDRRLHNRNLRNNNAKRERLAGEAAGQLRLPMALPVSLTGEG